MEPATHYIIQHLMERRIIGKKHTPEKKLLRRKLPLLNKEERKRFLKEYRMLYIQQYLLRRRKRTGKGMDWHISLNPRKLKDLEAL